MSETVENGVLKRLSASSINAFVRCPRYWWFRYVAKLPDPVTGGGAQRGTDGHKRIEHYLTTGENVLDPLEREGMQYMPNPKDAAFFYACEKSIKEGELFAGGVPLTGSIDLIETLSADTVAITDWKFKKDLDAYAATPNELRTVDTAEGLQMLAYARWAVEHLGAKTIILRHISFQTQNRRFVLPSPTVVTAAHVLKEWEKVTPIVERIKKVAALTSWNEVDISVREEGACEKYRGCRFKLTCFDPMASFAERLQKKMS